MDAKAGDRTALDLAFLQTYAENLMNCFNVYWGSVSNMGLLKKDYALSDEILPDRMELLG